LYLISLLADFVTNILSDALQCQYPRCAHILGNGKNKPTRLWKYRRARHTLGK